MIAVATNEAVGTWVVVAVLVMSGLGSLAGLVAIFATRREVTEIDRRVRVNEEAVVEIREKMETDKVDLIANGERRSTSLHRRIDPMVENTAAMKAALETNNRCFDNFTKLIHDLVPKK